MPAGRLHAIALFSYLSRCGAEELALACKTCAGVQELAWRAPELSDGARDAQPFPGLRVHLLVRESLTTAHGLASQTGLASRTTLALLSIPRAKGIPIYVLSVQLL